MTTIAIVEDNDTVRQTLSEWIDEAPGYRCVCACASSKEALVAIVVEQARGAGILPAKVQGGSARLLQVLTTLAALMAGARIRSRWSRRRLETGALLAAALGLAAIWLVFH